MCIRDSYNDDGKLMGLPLNRALRDENGEMYDAVAGTFLVVGLGEEDFASLTPELAQKYEQLFHQPEAFLKLGNRLLVLPVPDEPPTEKPRTKPTACLLYTSDRKGNVIREVPFLHQLFKPLRLGKGRCILGVVHCL